MKRLIHDSEGVYMIDEDCLRKKELKEREKEMKWQKERVGKNNYSASKYNRK